MQLFGVPSDCAEARTRTVPNDGHNPIYDESFEFYISVPELALLRFVVLDDDYINDDFIGQFTVPIECLQSGYKHVRLCASNGDVLPNATLFVHISLTHRYGSKQKLRRKRSWTQKQATDLRSVGVKAFDEQFKSASNVIHESIQLRKGIEKAMIDLSDECSLSESANIAQCLRVVSLRVASCQTVSACELVVTDQGYPTLKVQGEMTAKLTKTMNALEKASMEFFFVSQNASSSIEMIQEIHDTLVSLGDQLASLCHTNGIKGRKADKVAENFMWNMSVLRSEMHLLRAIKAECDCALKQMERVGPSLKRLFHRERDSLQQMQQQTSSSQSESFTIPIVQLSGASLSPEIPKQPVTPTSPGESRLKGILKKTTNNPSPVHFEIGETASVREQSSDESVGNASPQLPS